MKILFFIPFLFLTLGIEQCPTPVNEGTHAWIAVESQTSSMKITAQCLNGTPRDRILSYELKVEKEGKTGISSTFQKGSVLVPSRKIISLSQVGLSVSPDDCYRVRLRVYEGEKFVDEDSLSYP